MDAIDPKLERQTAKEMYVRALAVLLPDVKAALNRAFTLMADSRDGAGAERWRLLLSEDALLRCHGQANCTEVCPMELSPTDSILKLRRKSIFQLVRAGRRLDTSKAGVLA